MIHQVLAPAVYAEASANALWSALQNILIAVERDFLRLAIQNEVHRPRGIPDDPHLAQAHHTISKIGEYGYKHGEMVVHFALRKFRVHFDLASIGRLQLILETIPGHLGAIDPLVEKPIEASILLQIHLLGHVLFGDGFERLGGGG